MASACTSGCWRPSATAVSTCGGRASRSSGPCRRPRNSRTTTSGSSRPSGRIRGRIRAGLGEALAFHQAIGAERKAARLRYLTLRWADALKAHPRVKILTDLGEPAQAWGVAAVNIEGIDVRALAKFLMDEYRIVVVPLVGGVPPNSVFDYQALRVSPNVYTTLEEIDTFVMAMEEAIKGNMPETLGLMPAYPADITV